MSTEERLKETQVTLSAALSLIEAIVQNIGLVEFINATSGTGLSSLGYAVWMREAKAKAEAE